MELEVFNIKLNSRQSTCLSKSEPSSLEKLIEEHVAGLELKGMDCVEGINEKERLAFVRVLERR